jgi:hypothetical protein
MAFDARKQTTGSGGGSSGGQQQAAVGKQTLVDQAYRGAAEHGGSEPMRPEPMEAGSGPLSAIRFSDDADLVAVAEGKKMLASERAASPSPRCSARSSSSGRPHR